jgi:microsomal dipeptidase-like Zn-dependent dipeptidase
MVHRTGGLIGLCFDQRICGVGPGQRVPGAGWAHVVLRQIFGMADVILHDDRLDDAEKARIWDCLTIGSDYDGFIDPLSRYPTALSLELFARDLRELLFAHRHTRLIERVGVDVLLEKIAWRNAYDFAQRHLPAASR